VSTTRRLAALNAFDLEAPTEALTEVVPAAAPPQPGDCRCGHAADGHLQVGFHPGERMRCPCGCTAYRQCAKSWGIDLLLMLAVVLAVGSGWVVLLWMVIL
jgi:hypothetical protein